MASIAADSIRGALCITTSQNVSERLRTSHQPSAESTDGFCPDQRDTSRACPGAGPYPPPDRRTAWCSRLREQEVRHGRRYATRHERPCSLLQRFHKREGDPVQAGKWGMPRRPPVKQELFDHNGLVGQHRVSRSPGRAMKYRRPRSRPRVTPASRPPSPGTSMSPSPGPAPLAVRPRRCRPRYAPASSGPARL